jgi:hypothetical protein
MRRDRRFAGRPLHLRVNSRNGRFTFEFEFRGGFGRSFEGISPGPLYTQKRGRRWFFTLSFVLAFCFGFFLRVS